MVVQELIDKLILMPADAFVELVNSDGCSECNPYSYDNNHDAKQVELHSVKKRKRTIHTVLIS